jgi:hypothetical protein
MAPLVIRYGSGIAGVALSGITAAGQCIGRPLLREVFAVGQVADPANLPPRPDGWDPLLISRGTARRHAPGLARPGPIAVNLVLVTLTRLTTLGSILIDAGEHAQRAMKSAAQCPTGPHVRQQVQVGLVFGAHHRTARQFDQPGHDGGCHLVAGWSVLPAGEQFVDGGVLPGDADAPLYLPPLPKHVEARHRGAARVRFDEGGQDRTVVVLPAPFPPSRPRTEPAQTDRSTLFSAW